jgi:hypothetical protein
VRVDVIENREKVNSAELLSKPYLMGISVEDRVLGQRHLQDCGDARSRFLLQSSAGGMLFAHLKRILKLGQLRQRGPNGAHDEFLLAAIAQKSAANGEETAFGRTENASAGTLNAVGAGSAAGKFLHS